MSISRERLRDFLDLLRDHCIRGYLHFRIWKRINAAFKEMPEELESFDLFMIMTWQAHDDAARIHLTRLFDRNSRSISLHKLLRIARSNPQLFSYVDRDHFLADVEHDETLMTQDLRRLLERLKAHRTTYLAHLDDSLLRPADEILSDQALTYREMATLYDAASDMIKRYQKYFSDDTWHIQDVIGEHTVDRLFDFLRKHGR